MTQPAPSSSAASSPSTHAERSHSLAKPAAPRRSESTPKPETVETAITVRGFSAWYGDFLALDDLTFDIARRRVTALIGPSGCGKSTFLWWVNRMNDLVDGARCEGKMTLGELDLLDRRLDVVDLRRRVGMVFQKPNPFPKSVYDNIAFGPRLHAKWRRSDMDDLVERSLKQAALWDEVKDRLHKSALSLSGGQQQRLCIARALAVEPEVLLMDEPASALDPKSTARIEDLIRTLREDYTIAIVTHNMQQAARISDSTVFFYEGRLIEWGPTDDLFTNPRERQTEDYVTGRFG
jgi:phosphate transport system ATP-binding protein